MAELQAAGAIDDERYARRFAGDKRELERWGVDRIERELVRRGIEPELIAQTLSVHDREDELAAAMALLEERHEIPMGDRERDRAWRMLVRKGYGPELAYDAVRAHARRAAA